MHKPKTLFAAAAVLLFLGSQAAAGQYALHKIWDLQYAHMPDGTHRMVFKTCNANYSTCWWWTPSTTTGAADSVRNLATAAFLAGKQVNVQCGSNGFTCACTNAMVFEANVLASKCVFNLEGLQVVE
jgi:hypothetical protein